MRGYVCVHVGSAPTSARQHVRRGARGTDSPSSASQSHTCGWVQCHGEQAASSHGHAAVNTYRVIVARHAPTQRAAVGGRGQAALGLPRRLRIPSDAGPPPRWVLPTRPMPTQLAWTPLAWTPLASPHTDAALQGPRRRHGRLSQRLAVVAVGTCDACWVWWMELLL